MTSFSIDVQVLTCPITLGLFREPVMLPDGNTYEKKAIEDLIDKSDDDEETPLGRRRGRHSRWFGHIKCPLNPSVVFRTIDDATPNYTMKSMVSEFTRRHPRHPLVKESKKEQKELDLKEGKELMEEAAELTKKAAKLGDPTATLILKQFNNVL